MEEKFSPFSHNGQNKPPIPTRGTPIDMSSLPLLSTDGSAIHGSEMVTKKLRQKTSTKHPNRFLWVDLDERLVYKV